VSDSFTIRITREQLAAAVELTLRVDEEEATEIADELLKELAPA
jgi:hypothetical protein